MVWRGSAMMGYLRLALPSLVLTGRGFSATSPATGGVKSRVFGTFSGLRVVMVAGLPLLCSFHLPRHIDEPHK